MPKGNIARNCVILGATGRVGRLVGRAFDHHGSFDLAIWRQSRRSTARRGERWADWDGTAEPAALARVTRQIGAIDSLIVLNGVTEIADDNQKVNSDLALAALDAAKALGARQVFLPSSAAVYGRPANDAPIAETADCRPVSPYGRSKLAMETAAQEWSARQTGTTPHVTLLRLGNVAGADQLTRNAVRATRTAPLILDEFADGTSPLRSYIGPETLAGVLVSLIGAAAQAAEVPRILNVAAAVPVHMADLLEAMKSTGDLASWQTRRAGDQVLRSVVLDLSRLRKLHRFAATDSNPDEMIRQWRRCRGAS